MGMLCPRVEVVLVRCGAHPSQNLTEKENCRSYYTKLSLTNHTVHKPHSTVTDETQRVTEIEDMTDI